MSKTEVDKEMIKNLELLLAMDLVIEESHWESVEELDQLDSAEALDEESKKSSKDESQNNKSKKEVKK